MSVHAVIFDVYRTLLDVHPPQDADQRWARLLSQSCPSSTGMTRDQFMSASTTVIKRLLAEAKSRGIHFPEVSWSAVLLEVLPDLTDLSKTELEEFECQQAQTMHSTSLSQGAASVLRYLAAHGCHLGIASNAQAYTVRELNEALQCHGLHLDIFDAPLSFWSYAHGFSKPDPYVFRILNARLDTYRIPPAATMMVGDRMDNDIEPARGAGWQTWQLTQNESGGWLALLSRLHDINKGLAS